MDNTKRNPRGAGRKDRPTPWNLWCSVRAVMAVRGIKNPRIACRELISRGPDAFAKRVLAGRKHKLLGKPLSFNDEAKHYEGRDPTKPLRLVRRWGPRTEDGLTKKFFRLQQRYLNDAEFRDDCDYWLPHFIEAERTGTWDSVFRSSK